MMRQSSRKKLNAVEKDDDLKARLQPNRQSKRNAKNATLTELPKGYVLSDDDVVCGRGPKCLSHAGNLRFLNLIRASLPTYIECKTRMDQSIVIMNVIDIVQKKSPQGGFVKHDPIMDIYYRVSDDQVREKTAQAFRDQLQSMHNKPNTNNAVSKKSINVSRPNNANPDPTISALKTSMKMNRPNFTSSVWKKPQRCVTRSNSREGSNQNEFMDQSKPSSSSSSNWSWQQPSSVNPSMPFSLNKALLASAHTFWDEMQCQEPQLDHQQQQQQQEQFQVGNKNIHYLANKKCDEIAFTYAAPDLVLTRMDDSNCFYDQSDDDYSCLLYENMDPLPPQLYTQFPGFQQLCTSNGSSNGETTLQPNNISNNNNNNNNNNNTDWQPRSNNDNNVPEERRDELPSLVDRLILFSEYNSTLASANAATANDDNPYEPVPIFPSNKDEKYKQKEN